MRSQENIQSEIAKQIGVRDELRKQLVQSLDGIDFDCMHENLNIVERFLDESDVPDEVRAALGKIFKFHAASLQTEDVRFSLDTTMGLLGGMYYALGYTGEEVVRHITDDTWLEPTKTPVSSNVAA